MLKENHMYVPFVAKNLRRLKKDVLRGVGTELGQNDGNRFLALSTYSNGPELP